MLPLRLQMFAESAADAGTGGDPGAASDNTPGGAAGDAGTGGDNGGTSGNEQGGKSTT